MLNLHQQAPHFITFRGARLPSFPNASQGAWRPGSRSAKRDKPNLKLLILNFTQVRAKTAENALVLEAASNFATTWHAFCAEIVLFKSPDTSVEVIR